MFGTLGFQELMIILVIVLIIFGAGRLPQIGEGVGKALKGFKKEVNEPPPVADEARGQGALPASPAELVSAPAAAESVSAPATPAAGTGTSTPTPTATPPATSAQPALAASSPYQPGPERTPGTLAAQVYGGFGPETVQPAPAAPAEDPSATPYQEAFQPVTMEQRAASAVPRPLAQYPPAPAAAASAAPVKRPPAVVNRKAVARVQAKRAAMRQAREVDAQAREAAGGDLQSLGEGVGGALRTFREATTDVRNAIDPEMRTIRAELESAQKEVEQSVEAAKQPPPPPPT